jgi:hypothetical protein
VILRALRARNILRVCTAADANLGVVPSNNRSEVNIGQAPVLRAWEAIGSAPTLGDFLAAVAKSISPIVPFDSVGIVALEGDRYRFFAGYDGEDLQRAKAHRTRLCST